MTFLMTVQDVLTTWGMMSGGAVNCFKFGKIALGFGELSKAFSRRDDGDSFIPERYLIHPGS